MPNNLTGDYEAVLQVSLRQLNGILATLHQRRIDPAASPSFAHSGSFRVGERPLSVLQEASRYRSWVTDATTKMRVTGGTAELRTMSGIAPPGLAAMFETAWAGMDAARLEPVAAGSTRGVVEVQISNPTISVPPGSASSVVVHAMIRCHYVPDSGSAPLPEPLHGEVRALYTLAPRTLPDGRRVLRVQISAQDADIQFIPATGTITGADVNTVVAQVRRGIRAHFQPMDVELPADFAFGEFGGIGVGNSAICLPLQLSGGIPPAGALATVTNAFLGTNEFAIAVSQAYVQTKLDPLMNSIRSYADRYRVSVSFAGAGLATYRASVSRLSMAWRAGEIDVSGRIELITDADLAPNGYITFTQTITLALDVPTQTVSIVTVGDASVDESWWLPHSRAVHAVDDARDGALPGASATINAAFAGARGRLNGGLTTFDPYTSAKYTGLDVTPDGIIVRGRIDTGTRLNPIVEIVETDDGLAYTAFRSWVPGGFIDEFDWTWVEKTHVIPWFNKAKHIVDDHRFICAKPAGLKLADRICLHIRGTRVDHNGFVEPVDGGEWCRVSSHEPILTVPPWWMKVMVPIWVPDPPADFVLDELIAGHINMAGESARGEQVRANTLVHFTGREIDRPLNQISRALEEAALREASLLVVLVLPANTFAMRNREMESRLGELTERFAPHLLVTEDYAGGWTKLFAAPEHSSTHLVDARGRHAWSWQERELDPQALAHALEQHILAAPPPQTRLLRLAVQPGAPAPDTAFRDDQGREYSMRRLRGRPVRIAFWQSWSSPCLRELRRLQHQQEQGESTMLLAVNGGEDRAVLEEVRQRERFTFPLIHDPDQVIAARYGVTCWPTTVSINREGMVDHVQFGVTHDHTRTTDKAGV